MLIHTHTHKARNVKKERKIKNFKEKYALSKSSMCILYVYYMYFSPNYLHKTHTNFYETHILQVMN